MIKLYLSQHILHSYCQYSHSSRYLETQEYMLYTILPVLPQQSLSRNLRVHVINYTSSTAKVVVISKPRSTCYILYCQYSHSSRYLKTQEYILCTILPVLPQQSLSRNLGVHVITILPVLPQQSLSRNLGVHVILYIVHLQTMMNTVNYEYSLIFSEP